MKSARHWAGALICAAIATTTVGCAHDTSMGQKVDDTTITTKVKTALLGDPDVSGMAISVDTVGGNVMLSGFVDSQAQRQRALDLAGRVEGVSRVTDKMSIKTQ
jgi:hyperosmotically inducible protein